MTEARTRRLGVDPPGDGDAPSDPVVELLQECDDLPADEIARVIDLAATALGAESARLLVADYALASLLELGDDGATASRQPIDGTLAGRAFATGEIVASGEDPPRVWIPLADGTERIGVLELQHSSWQAQSTQSVSPLIRILVLILVSRRRYTDVFLRSRRAQPLTLAAEMQWDLLPPLTCSAGRASLSGILEPAYDIGGDSFDYAFNPDKVEFTIIDAVGHGMAAVLMAVATINSLRNSRREGYGLEAAYHAADEVIRKQFGRSNFVTAQTGSLSTTTGELTWLNAGHPLPLLVRDGSFIGEIPCRPSLPVGLGGSPVEVATLHLQPNDRLLFFSDGVIETRPPGGEQFGVERLADHLIRATLDGLPSAETVRRLSGSISRYNGAELHDDATLLLIDYHGSDPPHAD